MGVLHPLPRHALRMAALAAVLTVLVMAVGLVVASGRLSPGDTTDPPSVPAPRAVPHALVVQTAPDWVVRPLAPVTP